MYYAVLVCMCFMYIILVFFCHILVFLTLYVVHIYYVCAFVCVYKYVSLGHVCICVFRAYISCIWPVYISMRKRGFRAYISV